MAVRSSRLSRGIVLPKARGGERFWFSIDEVKQILAAAQDPYRTFFCIASETGMRSGEPCGSMIWIWRPVWFTFGKAFGGENSSFRRRNWVSGRLLCLRLWLHA